MTPSKPRTPADYARYVNNCPTCNSAGYAVNPLGTRRTLKCFMCRNIYRPRNAQKI